MLAALHDWLARLGVAESPLHPGMDDLEAPQWIVDQKFMPIEGRCYEIAYGMIPYDGQSRTVTRRIRAHGPLPQDWTDLDNGRTLEPDLHPYIVRGFRTLD